MTILTGELQLWAMKEPLDDDFARVEDYEKGQSPYLHLPRVNDTPRQVRLLGDLAKIADFTWYLGGSFAIVKSEAARLIHEKFPCFRTGPVEFVTEQGKPNNRLAKSVSQYVCIENIEQVELDWILTTYEEKDDGIRSITGTEDRDFNGLKDDGKSFIVKIPRVPGHGMYVRHEALRGHNFFCLRERSSFYCCTSEFKEFIESQDFSNVEFREMGGIVRVN
jgi:hypothetical protein